ncbi:MAG: ABC transporter substrate-binding protein [Deltaproteobacteria bacterium]|nr:ABC transporter substrate-binding protein [Deltaproteobacteria bacterium]
MRAMRWRWIVPMMLAAALAAGACRTKEQSAAPPERGYPQRIISHAPSYTEMLFAMGAGDRIVAVSDFCVYPPDEVAKLPKVGGLLNPNLERALALKPDLVVLMRPQGDLERRYQALGIPTLRLAIDSLDELYNSVERLGEAVGKPDEARALAAKIRGELDAVRASVKGKRRPRTLFVVEHQPGELRGVYVAAPKTFHGALVDIAGGDNIFHDLNTSSGYGSASVELIAERDPEVIIVMTPTGHPTKKDEEAERRVWSSLPTISAVRSGRVHLLQPDPISVPGPRIGASARILAKLIHSEIDAAP